MDTHHPKIAASESDVSDNFYAASDILNVSTKQMQRVWTKLNGLTKDYSMRLGMLSTFFINIRNLSEAINIAPSLLKSAVLTRL